MSEIRFDGRVAIVTGAGGVNDLGGSRSGEGKDTKAADVVVQEIKSKGGKAVSDYNSVEEGEKIVKTAIDNFGRIDILINNAGILRDKSVLKTSIEDWDLLHRIHLRSAFILSKACWPYFREQNFGRIIVTASTAGIYGNFGQSNYSSAKLGLVGLSNTLSVEGSKYNINCNAIVPVAASRLTVDVLPENLFQQFKPEFVAPIVVWLCHESCSDTGGVFEAAGGWVGRYRWSRSIGKTFIPPESLTLESLRNNWSQAIDMRDASMPVSVHEQMALLHNSLSGGPPLASESKDAHDELCVHRYGPDDVILYALSVGASTRDPENLRFLYENHEKFSVIPTYAVIPSLVAMADSSMIDQAITPYKIEFNPTKVLHGEQYLELLKPLPTCGVLKSKARVIDVLDKGSGALVIMEVETFDESGEKVAYNQGALFLVGSGNFGGKKMSDREETKGVVDPPRRDADVTVLEETSADQAALYRLTGDKNPLHIDPSFAAMGGFDKPILHGLCSLGYSVRQVIAHFAGHDPAKVKVVKARFAGTVLPGQTLKTEMWREGNRIHFQSTCNETGKLVISGAYVDILGDVLLSQPVPTSVSLSQPVPTSVSLSPQPVPTSVSDPNNPSSAELAFDTDDGDMLLTDVVFEEIARRIAMAPQLSKKVNGIFTFVIVKDRKEVKTWTMDMKQTPGVLYQGHSKGSPADCIIRITDQDMTALAVGELDPVRAFMTGKLKIKGNLMATQRLQALFELNSAAMYEKGDETVKADSVKADSAGEKSSMKLSPMYEKGDETVMADSAGEKSSMKLSPNLPERWAEMSRLISAGSSYGQGSQPVYDGYNGSGSYNGYNGSGSYNGYNGSDSYNGGDSWSCAPYDENSIPERMFAAGSGESSSGSITPIIDLLFEKWLPTRLDDMKELVPVIKTVYQWNILQKGQVASVWTLDLKNEEGSIYKGTPKSGKADCVLSIEDDFAVKIFEGKEDAMRAFMSGKLKITGNIMAAQKLQQVWADEADKVRGVLVDLKAGRDISDPKPSSASASPPSSAATDPDVAAYPATGIKGDIFFNIFKNRCHEEPDFMQRLRVCFQFNITKDGKPVCIWTADNRSTKDVLIYRTAPQGIKPDVTATVEDDDLLKILTGRVNPQRLFMMGRVKVKGNIMLLQKLNGLWAEFQKLGRTPELPLIVDIMLDDPLIPGLKSEGMVIDCVQRLIRIPEFQKQAPGFHQLDITKDGKVVSTWTLDLKEKTNFVRGPPKKGAAKADTKITVDDLEFARLVLSKVKLSEAISQGLVKWEGDQKVIPLFEKLFLTPTSLRPKL